MRISDWSSDVCSSDLGSIDVLIGTHAIFQQAVTYKALGLVVVDEQHRFGVAQRMLLTQKAEHPPHLLAMTATPIPRTLTLHPYGQIGRESCRERGCQLV